jgi:hypothetical protein
MLLAPIIELKERNGLGRSCLDPVDLHEAHTLEIPDGRQVTADRVRKRDSLGWGQRVRTQHVPPW